MTQRWIVLAMAVALAAAGCIGSDADDEALDTESEDVDSQDAAGDGSSRAEEPAASADAGPAPINRTHEDAANAGVVLIDPDQSLDAKTQFAKASYDNGLNGTWVLGYEIQPEPGHTELTVETTADFADPWRRPPSTTSSSTGPRAT